MAVRSRTAVRKGWKWPRDFKYAHYFVGTHALCGQATIPDSNSKRIETDVVRAGDDCPRCARIVTRKAKR